MVHGMRLLGSASACYLWTLQRSCLLHEPEALVRHVVLPGLAGEDEQGGRQAGGG